MKIGIFVPLLVCGLFSVNSVLGVPKTENKKTATPPESLPSTWDIEGDVLDFLKLPGNNPYSEDYELMVFRSLPNPTKLTKEIQMLMPRADRKLSALQYMVKNIKYMNLTVKAELWVNHLWMYHSTWKARVQKAIADATARQHRAKSVPSPYPFKIDLKIDFTSSELTSLVDTSDYDHVDVRRVSGSTPPDETCDNGSDTIVASNITNFSTDWEYTDNTGQAGATFSYRSCAYDSSGNLIATSWVAGITSGPLPTISLNSASGQSCDQICAASSKVCVSVGTNSSDADNGKSYHYSGSCSSIAATCSTVMTDQSAQCVSIDADFTYCACNPEYSFP